MTKENAQELAVMNQAPTPMELIQSAISSNVTPEALGQLMDLQERWEANNARKEFDRAMVAVQGDMPEIVKTKQVCFKNKAGGFTEYKHEDLSEMVEILRPVLAKHGLSFRWRTASDKNLVTVTCLLSHQMGHNEETSLSGGIDTSGGKNAIQGVASVVTYLQRYTLKAALGIAAGHDDDAQSVVEPDASSDWIAKIENASTAAELHEIGQELKGVNMPQNSLNAVKKAYSVALKSLREADNGAA